MTAIKYIHHTPGRLRIKGHHFKCHGEQARKAVAALQAMKGVELVQLNGHAGSLTVHYDTDLHTQADLLSTLEKAGCLHVADVHAASAAHGASRSTVAKESVAGVFGKALVGVLAQRTATRLIGALI